MKRITLVLADDVAEVRVGLTRFVSGLGGVDVVAEAEDADGTLAAVSQHQPDVLLLDLFMPGGGGLRVLDGLQAIPSRPTVIVLTAHPEAEYERACRDRGADHFLDKIRDLGRLLAILRDLTGRGSPEGTA